MKTVLVPTLAFLLILFSMGFVVHADDGRNDMMCTALYKVAFQQEGLLGERRPLVLEFYAGRIALYGWNYRNTANDKYDIFVYGNFVERYMNEMDTATALLHWSRCETRTRVIWEEYKASR